MDNRLVYKTGLEIVQKAGLDPAVVKLTQSTLRLTQKIAPGKTSYQFPILVNNNGPANTLFPDEVRLNQQDSFIASVLRVTFSQRLTEQDLTFIDYPYPSPTVFSTVGPPTEAASLEVFYKGAFKITVNNVVVMPSLLLERFYFVPTSQKAAAIANDGVDASSDGLSITEPNIVFIGSKNNLIELGMQGAPATLPALPIADYITLTIRGLLAQNSTIIT
jgi:hypothetical protein